MFATGDSFPVGMRVLAVDDDQTSLTMLEGLLRKCQYQITTTTESIKALEMLRNNRNMFDLVICDVNMPDMDGFKLLELVEHEMDLPVIMLSEYSDKEMVMRGVMNGACDYLTKPVRIEEIQNIWQHVVRRRIGCKDQNKSATEEKACNMAVEVSQGIRSEHKRKAQSEEEEQDDHKRRQENQKKPKKPRLVWDAELHRKFVLAVNQLGCDKAFPKRILELMKVEGLTRENVASHLQKYKNSLEKLASMVAELGSSDLGLVGGYGDFPTVLGRISSTTHAPYASGLDMRGISSSSSAVMQPFQSQKSMLYDANQSSSLPLPGNYSSPPMHTTSGDFRNNHSSLGVSPSLLNYNPESWYSAAQLSNLPVNSVLNNDQVPQNLHSFTSHTGNSPVDSCSTSDDINVQDGSLGSIILASGYSYTQQHQSWVGSIIRRATCHI